MQKKKGQRLVVLSLLLILGLAAYLRLSGITWGFKGGYGHELSFHPDEFISIRGMLPIKLLACELRAPDAYFEGTFNYYLWAVPEMFRESRPLVGGRMRAGDFKFVLLCGRLMSVTFDLISLVLLFAIITEMTGQPLAGLFGALLYGVFPMQVIYSHFMRTYALSNLLCVVVIWLSIKALKQRHWLLFLMTGAAAGLAAVTRYSTAVVFCVPCFFVLFQGHADHEPWLRRIAKSIAYLLSGPLWLLAGGFVLGVFAGEPMLFFDFKSVVDAVSFEISHYTPAGARNPFDLAPVWRYFSVLIPYATYPVLWLVIYLSTLYVILRRPLWPVVVPLCIFIALYTYSMAKGYLDAFARLVMVLLPVFCIFAGLAFGDIVPKLLKRPLVFSLVTILTLLLTIPSIVFDVAYDRAMQRRDVRELLRHDMRELVNDRSSTAIAVDQGGCSFYTAMPAVRPLKSNNVAVQLQNSVTAPADFFVMGFERPLAENLRNSTTHRVEAGGVFRFVKAYSRAPTVFGKALDLSNFPPDMTYPFPTILLFRNSTKP
jgi:hypothetical protein